MRNGHPETGWSADEENTERGKIMINVQPETGLPAVQENVGGGKVV